MATLKTPLPDVVGGKTAKALESQLELRTVGELLSHYPRRMAERGELTDLANLRVDDEVTVLAQVRSSQLLNNRPQPGRRASNRIEVVIGDAKGTLKLTFFNQAWRLRELPVGANGFFAGKVSRFGRQLQLVNPEFLSLDEAEKGSNSEGGGFAGALIPVYPATAKVRSWTIAAAIGVALDSLDPLDDPLPVSLLAEHQLIGLEQALNQIHRPGDRGQWAAARERLRWDEALGVQLVLAQRRVRARGNPANARPGRPDGLLAGFDATLPFSLTGGQREVGELLANELSASVPMQRLLQGEVGSGKTIVALRAMLQVVDSGAQAALLAPTEVLATQHARSIELLLGELARAGELGAPEQATRLALLTGSLSASVRKAALLDAASGRAGLIIGTHALIQERVAFADLGLAVIDEQHRFGVEQRDALRAKAGAPPHTLVMTATPIPRTVAMTVFGDLETSTLRELPRGRSPITTSVVPVQERPAWVERVWARIREEVAAGHQAFVVCARIGDADPVDRADEEVVTDAGADDQQARRPAAAAEEVYAQLSEGPLASVRLGLLHGRLPAEEKDQVMTRFAAGELDVLVATTVVEVGVDVPNATVMAIMDADRFGVSQLHQLRGRVGRGTAAGVCLLLTAAPPGTPARERLDSVAATTDGFELARLDLQARREGDVLGASQSGRRSGLKLLSLLRDESVIVAAREVATALVAADPQLADHPRLAQWLAGLVDEDRVEFLEKT